MNPTDLLGPFPAAISIALLLLRLVTGALFILSGWHKLTNPKRREQMEKTLAKGRIPAPRTSSPLLAAVELVGGTLLVVGLFTPLAAAVLAVMMVVAIVTVQLKGVEGDADTSWWENFLFLPDVLYLAIFLALAAFGAGSISLDAALR